MDNVPLGRASRHLAGPLPTAFFAAAVLRGPTPPLLRAGRTHDFVVVVIVLDVSVHGGFLVVAVHHLRNVLAGGRGVVHGSGALLVADVEYQV
jgi:hypothetical protein